MDKQEQSASKRFGVCRNEGSEAVRALKRGFVQATHLSAAGRHTLSQPRFSIKSDASSRWLESLSEATGYLALAVCRGLPSNKGAADRRLTTSRLCCHKAAPSSSAAERRRYAYQ